MMSSSKTWFFDIDGTLVRHLSNEEINSGAKEQLLPQVEEFINNLYRKGDYIILTTARWESQRLLTERMLKKFRLNYHHLIMGIGSGERILVNDIKPIDTEDNFRETLVITWEECCTWDVASYFNVLEEDEEADSEDEDW